MDLMKLGTQLLSDKLGSGVDGDSLSSALSGLLGGGDGNIDVAGLASKMSANSDLGDVLSSWLGDGDNSPISADKVAGLLGDSNIADFASKLGLDSSTAASGLAEALPQLMDKASSGGSLLDSVGGVGGLMDAAKSFLK
ncbi:MAG: YidB family protein [Halioglobus sp.]